MTAIDKITPYQNKRIKGTTQKWFDSKVLEKLNARDKFFKKFKRSRLDIDKQLHKKAKFDASKLITQKNQHSLKRSFQKQLVNLKNYGNLSMPNKTVVSNFNVIEEANTLTYDTCLISKIF